MDDRKAYFEEIEERPVQHPEGWTEVIALPRWYWDALALVDEALGGLTAEEVLAQCDGLLRESEESEDLHGLFAYQIWNLWQMLDAAGEIAPPAD